MVGKILLWLIVLLLVAAGALGGGVWLYLSESVAAVQARSEAVKQAEEYTVAPEPGQPTTALIIGYDLRKGPEAEVAGRSDTVMLLRADPRTKTLSLLSFPRDLVVDIPGCAAHPPTRDRINTAYTLCGPSGTVRTVSQLTGIGINYVIVVNFRAFKEIVNKVGGVYLDVDRRYFNDNTGPEAGYATIDLHPGYQRVFGGPALDYARYRHTDSDFHRIARQQAFMKAFKQRVQSSFSITKLPGIINVITETVEVVGKKNLDVEAVLGYARFLYELPSGHFFQVQIQGVSGYAELSAPEESISAAVREFLNPDVTAAEKATQVASGRPPRDTTPRPAEVSIEVLNGNGVDGSADSAAYLLSQRGYNAVNGGNADNFRHFNTEVTYDPARAGAREAAQVVADLFGDAELAAAAPGRLETMLQVVVGHTFEGTIADAPVDRTPEHQPPAVVRDPGDTAELLRPARKKVDFPLLAPIYREQSSSLDFEEPLRVYRLEQHDAVRLVYRTGTGAYWGIQETSWTDAPILSGENVTRRIGGRTYELYYDSAKLHMVAFEENDAVYWVSNSLLDELSNETMLAIAKGLKPLSAAQ